jgi:general secretion pathway protein H
MTSRSDADAGFTLIELVVVIAVIGLALALVSIRSTPVGAATHARAAAQEISSALRAARGEAVATNQRVAFTIDVNHRSYSWGGRSPQGLPGDIGIALLTTQDQANGAVAQIRFYPDGSSTGGRVTIDGAGAVWWVGVDWISGRVSIVKKVA